MVPCVMDCSNVMHISISGVCTYFKSCSLHGKLSVQNNKGYFLCHVSGSGILSGMKVKCYKLSPMGLL